MTLRILHIDFESHYKSGKDGHTLRTLTYQEYIDSPKFQVIGLGMAWDEGPTTWVPGPDVATVLAGIDWHTTVVQAFNALFDCSILHYHYGTHPQDIMCTQSLATTAGLRMAKGGSLDAVSEALRDQGYRIEIKGKEVISADGKYYEDFTPQELAAYGEYCCKDVRISRDILHAVLPLISTDELKFQSMILKAGSDPTLILDKPLLEAELARVIEQQRATLAKAAEAHGCSELQFRALIQSNVKFKDLLEAYGCECPMKVSLTTGMQAPALAKTDQGLLDLLEHESLDIQAFAAARLGAKSTSEVSKISRMIAMADHGPLPMCYNISGAGTHRLSASQKLNVQGLASGRVAGTTNACRRAIRAPEGFLIGSTDSNSVEMRVGAYIANDQTMLQIFSQGRDLYSELGSDLYKRPAEEIRAGAKAGDEIAVGQRFKSKTVALGGIFGSGPAGFQTFAASQMKLKLDLDEAKELIGGFRTKFTALPFMWRQCDAVLSAMLRGGSGYFGGPEGDLLFYDGSRELFGMAVPGIRLPDGNWLNYLNLREEPAPAAAIERQLKAGQRPREYQVTYDTVLGRSKVPTGLYGSKLFQNCTQAVAFAILKQQKIIFDRSFRVVGSTHDEMMYLVPEGQEPEAKRFATECFAWTPEWANDCPLASETGIAKRYGDA